ncbi:MAG: TonB-dependent receptor [Alistipes sp.]
MNDFFSKFKNSLMAKTCLWTLALLLAGIGTAFAQPAVRGTVTDEAGNPLVGVTVVVAGSNKGATTDTKGTYSIAVPKGGTLEFSFLGMTPYKKICGGGITVLDVTLKEDAARLDEVVILGFGSQRRADVTAAVSQIDGKELQKMPMSNISQGLAGRLSGLISVQNSGQPGADQASMTIRGARAGILYIVDGVPRSINDIDPNDVESVSLLKDGAAVAVYGLEAAGGVMIVTTKKGKAGGVNLTYKGSYGGSFNTSYPEFLDGPGYAYYYNKALELDGQKPVFTAQQVQMMQEGTNGWGNTNWIKEIFGTGTIQQHSVTSTGGGENINYFASLGYMNQTGNIKNFDYDRYNLRTNIEAKIASHLTFTLGMAGQIGDQKSPGFSGGGSSGAGVQSAPWLSIAEQAAFAHPYLPMVYNGMPTASVNSYGNTINPVAATEQSGYSKSQTISLQTNAALQWDLPWVKGLSVKVMGSYDRSATSSKILSIPYNVMLASIPNSTTSDITYAKALDPRGSKTTNLSEGYNQWRRITSQASISYKNTFAEKHTLDLLALVETRDFKTNRFSASGKDIPFPQLPELDFATTPSDNPISGMSNAQRRVGFVFRAQYNYADKYLAEFSGRYDGSYKFIGNVSGRRWGFFPSVSVGWRMSEEKFFQPLRKVVDNFKLRASFGSLGDDGGSSPYAFMSTFSNVSKYPSVVLGGVGQNGIMTSLVANEMLTWERSYSYNIGFDLAMWNGKLGVEFDAFYNYIFDILAPNSGKPASMGGYFPTYVNNNAQDVRGIDVKLTHRNRIGKDFQYGVTVNFTWAKDRWTRYQDSPNTPDYAKHLGKSRYMTMGFMADGLFQSEEEIDNSPWISGSRPRVGDIKYIDQDGDGTINYAQDRVFLGRGQRPQFNGSLNLNASWKGIEFDIMFVGAAVCDVSLTGTYYNYNEDNTIFTRPFKAGANSPRYLVEQAWTPTNPDATYPRLSLDPPNSNNAYASSFWYRDGKYLRLKSIHLGYSLPKSWLSKLRIDKVKVYIEGNNLCTWSGLPKGIDPEWPGVTNGYYPQQRSVVGGIEITF